MPNINKLPGYPPQIVEIDFPDDNAWIKSKCPVTKEPWEIVVPYDQYYAWTQGKLIQEAFPQLTNDQRELLKTGLTPKGWDIYLGGNL